ncbi:MAG: hypothetical protein JOZ16_16985 [Methylobacteriaceae bacterium]|nr:hypothetical protein [Methylobacteriaceae bacterium]
MSDSGFGGIGQDEMTKTFTFLGLLVAGMLVTATFLGVPGPSVLQAQEDQRVEATDNGGTCRMVEVALDEGYGISRSVTRTDCSALR